jgi:DNA-directed RNA polymerase subunit RPC12/RpoP
MLYRAISRFELDNGKTLTIRCSCGAEPLRLCLKKRHLYADCFCPCCEEYHNYIFRLQGLKAEPPFILGCEEMDIRLACIGARECVREAMDEESALILDYAEELRDYFVKPTIIGRSLLCLNKLLVARACLCIDCGREDMDILILSDRLVIACPHCGRSAVIYASRPADLHLLNRISRISLHEGGMRIRY